MTDVPAKPRLTAEMLRAEGWRLLGEARAALEPRLRSELSRQALDLAQVAEMMDATDDRGPKGTIIPAPRRFRRRKSMASEQDGSS